MAHQYAKKLYCAAQFYELAILFADNYVCLLLTEQRIRALCQLVVQRAEQSKCDHKAPVQIEQYLVTYDASGLLHVSEKCWTLIIPTD